MKGDDYLNHFVLPNFYFHCTAAYAILRHSGVDVGKLDFLGAIPLKGLIGVADREARREATTVPISPAFNPDKSSAR